jgi:hypothetical protein
VACLQLLRFLCYYKQRNQGTPLQLLIQDAGDRQSRSQYNHQLLFFHDWLQDPIPAASYLFSRDTPDSGPGADGLILVPVPSVAVAAKGTAPSVCFVTSLPGGISEFEFFNLFVFSEL